MTPREASNFSIPCTANVPGIFFKSWTRVSGHLARFICLILNNIIIKHIQRTPSLMNFMSEAPSAFPNPNSHQTITPLTPPLPIFQDCFPNPSGVLIGIRLSLRNSFKWLIYIYLTPSRSAPTPPSHHSRKLIDLFYLSNWGGFLNSQNFNPHT